MAKVSSDLANLYQEYQAYQQQSSDSIGFNSTNSQLPMVGDRVVIDAVASGDANALKDDLENLGLQDGAVYGSIVSGQLPIAAIGSLAGLEHLKFVRPAYSTTGSGSVTSQADTAMLSDVARTTFGVDGAGVTVGTISDSFD